MTERIHLEAKKYTTQLVGELRTDIITLLKLPQEPTRIVIYPGAIKHIKRKHQHAFKTYFNKIPDIIANPDYVGITQHHMTRIEYIKRLKDPILVALKYDAQDNLFISSMYIIEENRIEKRLEKGKVVPLVEGIHVKEKKQKYRNQRVRRR